MRRVVRSVLIVLFLVVAICVAGIVYLRTVGVGTRPAPGPIETAVARTIRALALPREVKARPNPVPASAEARSRGMEHFARYCAMCHANDGSGVNAPLAGVFPPPPDMRSETTQGLTDGEIFYIIENGVRFTAMPAFGTGTPDPKGEELAWQLVHFIRQLPRITPDEIAQMKERNPL
jgi:mono/diheme cytochrome c family protein